MAYAIGYFVFGAVIPDDVFQSWDVDVFAFDGILNQNYAGHGGELPVFVGVEKFRIDEATDLDTDGVTKLVSRLFPSSLDIIEWNGKIAAAKESALPQAAKDYIAAIVPNIFLTWGTS